MNSDRPLAQPGALRTVLEALDEGKSAADIAKGFGISDVALYRFLMRNAPEDWKAISAGRALATIDAEDRALDGATNRLELGRARERMNQARWTLERASRAIYGDRVEVAHTGQALSEEDAGLLTSARELLDLFKARRERVIESADCAPAALEEKP